MEIEIVSKDSCGYCTAAKRKMDQLGWQYTELKLHEDISREALLERAPGARTVPQIFLDGDCIGGYDGLLEHLAKQAV